MSPEHKGALFAEHWRVIEAWKCRGTIHWVCNDQTWHERSAEVFIWGEPPGFAPPRADVILVQHIHGEDTVGRLDGCLWVDEINGVAEKVVRDAKGSAIYDHKKDNIKTEIVRGELVCILRPWHWASDTKGT